MSFNVQGGLVGVSISDPMDLDVLTWDASESQWVNKPVPASVTSVGLSMPSQFTVTGSPVTSAGTLGVSWNTEANNTVLAGPSSAGPSVPTFRALANADVSTLTCQNISATSNSTLTTLSALSLPGTQVSGNISGDAANITATSNSTLTTLSALSLPGSQVSGNISGNAANITATSNSTLTTLSALSLPYSQVTGGPATGVTSVGLALPSSTFTISGSPVTSTGTLTGTFATQLQNLVLASPNGSSGTPSWRALADADLPTQANVTAGTYAIMDVTTQGIIDNTFNSGVGAVRALIGSLQTTNATPTNILTFPIPNNSAIGIHYYVCCCPTTTVNTGYFENTVLFANNAGSITSASGTQVKLAGSTAAVTTTNSGTTFELQVAGVASTTIEWQAYVTYMTVAA